MKICRTKIILITIVFLLISSCQTNQTDQIEEKKSLPELISDDPSLSEEERQAILAVEILLFLHELEKSKVYRLETDAEYNDRIKRQTPLR